MKKFLSFLMMAVFSASLFAATYTVAGDNTTVFGKAWTPAETANDMTLVDGLYTFAKTDVTLPAGSIAFKVCQDHAWTNSWPAQNYSLSIPASGKYDITITFNESTKDVNAKADKKEDVVVLPSIAMHGNFLGSWADTENFTVVEGNETAVLTLNLAAGNYEFGMRIGGSGNWTSNGVAFTRENPSAVVEAGQGNLTLAADKEGTYTFTWTFATNTLAITFPEAGDDPQPAEMTTIYDWAGEVGTTFFGTTGVEISTVKIHTNTDAVPAIKFGSSYANADGKWVAIKPAKGGFKAGDVLSVAAVFNNADDTKYAQIDLRAANGDTRIWLSDSASTINGRTQAGEPIVQTYTLEADQDSLFLGRYGNTAMFVTLLKVERAAGGETPEDPAKFYITGDAATVGESLAWNPAAIKSTEDAYTLSLAAGNYKLKVTVDGTWATAKGFGDLTLENKQGLSNDNDGNICFTLAEAGDVVVTYTAEAFTVTGNFYVAPVEVKYYMKHNFEGGEEWTWKEMSLMPAEESGDDVTYVLENVIFRGSGVNINTKAEDEGAMWVPAENIVAYDGNLNPATLGAGDKVVFMFVPELVSVHEYKYGLSAIIVEKADPIVPPTPEEHTYTVAGSSTDLFGTAWAPTKEANDMLLVEGLYTWEKTDLTLAAGSIEFKVCEDHAWTNSWPAQNYNLVIPEAGIYTITITFNAESKEVNAVATKTGSAVVIPTVAMHGNFLGSWADTENFTVAEDNASASLTLTIAAGNYEFGMRIGGAGNWTANGAEFSRQNPSAVVVKGQGNLKLAADEAGEYTFTWTFATNTLAITFPTPTGFEETVAAEKATKILRNGQIFILKGDKIYNVMGGTIK